jgi:hypothetical protein
VLLAVAPALHIKEAVDFLLDPDPRMAVLLRQQTAASDPIQNVIGESAPPPLDFAVQLLPPSLGYVLVAHVILLWSSMLPMMNAATQRQFQRLVRD